MWVKMDDTSTSSYCTKIKPNFPRYNRCQNSTLLNLREMSWWTLYIMQREHKGMKRYINFPLRVFALLFICNKLQLYLCSISVFCTQLLHWTRELAGCITDPLRAPVRQAVIWSSCCQAAHSLTSLYYGGKPMESQRGLSLHSPRSTYSEWQAAITSRRILLTI